VDRQRRPFPRRGKREKGKKKILVKSGEDQITKHRVQNLAEDLRSARWLGGRLPSEGWISWLGGRAETSTGDLLEKPFLIL